MVKRAENSLHQIFTEESLLTQLCLGQLYQVSLNLQGAKLTKERHSTTFAGEPGSPDKPWGLRIYFR
ncbi:MAG: hypothetical protein ACRCZY_08735 [Phocaeicola sp.]